MTDSAPAQGAFDIHIQGSWSTLRRKRLINLGDYENEELAIELPWPLDKLEEGVLALGVILDKWESEQKKNVNARRRAGYSWGSEDKPKPEEGV